MTTETQKRLALICGMFGSAHVGQRAAAAAMADKLVRGLEIGTPHPRLRPRPICRRWATGHDRATPKP